MTDINLILRFFFYIFLESIIIQHINMLSDYKIKNKAYTFALITANSFLIAYSIAVTDRFKNIPKILYLLIFMYWIFCRLILYALVFRKLNFKIVYIFIFTVSTNQIYCNLLKNMTKSENQKTWLSFLSEFLILSAIMLYIRKNNKAEVYKQIIASLSKKLYVLIIVMMLIASVFVMGSTMERHDIYEKYLLLPSMIGLLISTAAVISIGISENEKKSAVALLSKQVEGQIEYYEKINKIYGEFRSFRHDYKNHVLCLRGLITAGKIEDALEYMENMQDMSAIAKNKFHTGNIIIDALLNDKEEKAEKVCAKLDFNGIVPSSGISNADLCIIIANAIDNAIEACSKDVSENTKVIKIDSDLKQGYFFFRASNPMFEEVKLKGKNKVATSKADKEHHGFGVANIVRTAEKYSGTAEISANNGEFTIEVQLLLEQT